MNEELRLSLPVFDELERRDESWNVYQYMLKLSSATVGKIMLGADFNHFTDVDAHLHRLPLAIAQTLALNKKISSMGEWYSHMPFGDPKRLKDLQKYMFSEISKTIEESKKSGIEDLPLQDAALKAANIVGRDAFVLIDNGGADIPPDYFTRAVDSSGSRLPTDTIVSAVTVAAGAGFTTTSSLLSWLVYGLVTYSGAQERLVQELVNQDFKDGDDVTPELIEELPELDKYVKVREQSDRSQPDLSCRRCTDCRTGNAAQT
jgi:cytochrome P450